MTVRVCLAAALAALAISPLQAVAKGGTTVVCNDEQVCTVVADDGNGGHDDGGGSTADICQWHGKSVACATGNGTFDPGSGCYLAPASPLPASGPVLAEYRANGGSILWATCPYGGSGGYVWQPGGEAKPQITAAMVRAQAQRLVPEAAIGLAPHGSTLVNIETVMWADAPPGQALRTVTLLGRKVAIRLTLEHVAWTFGDGDTDPDGPAGKPYDDSGAPCRERTCADYFGHVYTRTGRVEVGAVASWHASFTVDGGQAQQLDGAVPGPASRATIQVKQARAVLVPNPGEH